MRWSLAYALGVTAGCIATPAQAAPDLAACDRLKIDPDALNSRTEAPELPADWSEIARASRNWLAVSTEAGSTYCSNIGWHDSYKEFDRFADRFLGLAWSGYEAWGYLLIDTTGTGNEIDTGAKPVFSPGGYHFATVQWSEAGWGGFEGFVERFDNDWDKLPSAKRDPYFAGAGDGWKLHQGDTCPADDAG